jgi:hypothetical protein
MRAARAIGAVGGGSAVELLVALALFTLAALAALEQHQAAGRARAIGESLAELQQGIRSGYDRLANDLAAAGLGVDPDGAPGRPDEPIEGAFVRAIVLRADLDGATPDASDPETALAAGGPFENVATANDEIVAWLLAKSDGSSPDSLAFDADVVGVPRDGRVERVSIGGVSLSDDDPPYTLYRVTVRPDSAAVLRTPVTDGVRTLRFVYLDAAGRAIVPPGGEDDEASVRARAAVRRVHIEIEGVAREADPLWRDPADPDPATSRRRKFRLEGEVAPQNLVSNGVIDR